LLFHGNTRYANVPQYYVTRTVLVLLLLNPDVTFSNQQALIGKL